MQQQVRACLWLNGRRSTYCIAKGNYSEMIREKNMIHARYIKNSTLIYTHHNIHTYIPHLTLKNKSLMSPIILNIKYICSFCLKRYIISWEDNSSIGRTDLSFSKLLQAQKKICYSLRYFAVR